MSLNCMKTGLMVYMVGASSLNKSLNATQYKCKRFYESRVTAIPCLSLNTLSINPLKNLQNLLQKRSSAKNEIW